MPTRLKWRTIWCPRYQTLAATLILGAPLADVYGWGVALGIGPWRFVLTLDVPMQEAPNAD